MGINTEAYQYSIRYKAGKHLSNADALSKLPRSQSTSEYREPGDLVHLINHLSTTTTTASSIKAWTHRDPVLSKVRKYIQSGWPDSKVSEDLKPYFCQRNELSLSDGCVVWGARVIARSKTGFGRA